jgi:hypothetical protein
MSGMSSPEAVPLKWRELSAEIRAALDRRLEGFYGGTHDATVFESLTLDKQQALLILARRLRELKLWEAVRRITNLWGTGGVGMHFLAWPFLESTLKRRGNFSTWFATHRDTTLGFIERGTGRRASLHLLYADGGESRGWEAHFDLYNPWASPLNAWRHLAHEKIRRETPDWRIIGASLGYF